MPLNHTLVIHYVVNLFETLGRRSIRRRFGVLQDSNFVPDTNEGINTLKVGLVLGAGMEGGVETPRICV